MLTQNKITSESRDRIKNLAAGKVLFDEPMARHTTFKIGGVADVWFEPQDLADLIKIRKVAREEELSFYVIGAGSNLLVGDEGIRGIVVRLTSEYFSKIEITDAEVKAGSGVLLTNLLSVCRKNELSGFEELIGIPATLGGALAMNAGSILSPLLEEVRVLKDDDSILKLALKDINYGYRSSSLANFILLDARFKLQKRSTEEIEDAMRRKFKRKQQTQELVLPSAGCMFKNPPAPCKPAGKLIDESGLKGLRRGDAQVSVKHANFIVNIGRARCSDVLALIELVREKVRQDHGVNLELEVKILP